MMSVESRLNEALETIKQHENLIISLKAACHAAQVKVATIDRKYILMGWGLSEVSVARLNEAFKNSTDNAGLKEAINVEKKRGAQ